MATVRRTQSAASAEDGMLLVGVAMMSGVLLLMGLGLLALVGRDGLTMRHRLERQHLRQLAHGALDVAAATLADVSFDDALSGRVRASAGDAVAVTSYELAGGRVIELRAETAWLTCGRTSSCTTADRRRVTAARPWGQANPQWAVVLQGLASRWWPGVWHRGSVVVVWVGDDAREVDGDPMADDATGPLTGQGIVRLHAVAYGMAGGRAAVEAELLRYCETREPECQPGIELSGRLDVDDEM